MVSSQPSAGDLATLTAGFLAIYLVLDGAARWTGSFNGECGAPICLLVIGVALGVERVLFGMSPSAALRGLSFGRLVGRGLLAGLVAGGVLLACVPVFAHITGQPMALRAGSAAVAVGVFLQGGIAEELL